MKRHRRPAPTCCLLVVIAFALPNLVSSRTPAASNLADQVSIRRDTYGIPHILAETEEAAAFGFGYAQAEDHCLEIARSLVSARGEEAKYFGTGVEGDLLLKLYGNLDAAARDLQQVSSLYRKIVNAYADGVNFYVQKHRNELPAWIPSFNGVDVMASRRSGAIRSTFSQAAVRALQRKYPSASGGTDYSPAGLPSDSDAPADDLGAPVEAPGSNAFVLAGSRTTTGAPILLGNPHLNWSSLYWEAQVTVPGKINFFGSTLAGIPVLRAGFNEHLGWVTTNNSPDVSDIFALTLNPRNPDHYLFEGRSRPLIKREVSVEVKGADGTFKTEKRTYWDSHLGKILYRTADKAFAINSTQLDAIHYYEGFYLLSKTRNLKQFLAVMERNLVPTSNFTYADADGNIMYMWNARIPRRPDDGTDYSLDVPAATKKYVWTKMLAPRDFPRLLNPSGGYSQNCNNPPWYGSLRNLLDPQKYPAYLEADRMVALRPQMALQMLESQEKFSFEDVIRIKFNTRMLLADRVKQDLLKAAAATESPSDFLQRGRRTLEAWDNRVDASSKGAVLFQRFWDTYSRAVPQPYAVPWDPAKPAATPYGLSDPTLAVKQLEDAVVWTAQRYGKEDIAWGDVHRFRFGALDLPADGASGNYGLFRVVQFNELPDGKQVAGQIAADAPPVGFGDAWVLAVDFSRPVRASSVLAYGESTQTSSKHSSDQIQLFAGHQLRPVWFGEADIKAHLEREYHP